MTLSRVYPIEHYKRGRKIDKPCVRCGKRGQHSKVVCRQTELRALAWRWDCVILELMRARSISGHPKQFDETALALYRLTQHENDWDALRRTFLTLGDYLQSVGDDLGESIVHVLGRTEALS